MPRTQRSVVMGKYQISNVCTYVKNGKSKVRGDKKMPKTQSYVDKDKCQRLRGLWSQKKCQKLKGQWPQKDEKISKVRGHRKMTKTQISIYVVMEKCQTLTPTLT